MKERIKNRKNEKRKHSFSDAIVKMAKRLRLDLNRFGDFDDYDEKTWKSPIPEFVKMLYEKRFNKTELEDE